ncbi:MAG: GPR endopeptidase [Sulfobacillus thermosulfidooxidans]|uniref:GPR endopeptidase n=1 Tax=Sulfobacillus TaxID=28033 RepID=UPI000CD2027C|nr:GPR endopeptidase [Sulfobacillus sp. hq2]POB09203.1 GPR endopeptidase [Sulfobacillus sp. hq2]PSR36465.1 MAG: GPR endopeptidase [Sulfobacillus thermosulfidooxidans]
MAEFRPISVATDMAIEARDIVRGEAHEEVPGVRVDKQKDRHVDVTRVEVFNSQGARLMGKPQGHYVTLDVPGFKEREAGLRADLVDVLTDELKALIPEDTRKSILVVGLGNWNATPDALGPRVVERLLVTRHLSELVPPEIQERMRPVAAVAPGVLGTTGIETLDMIKGIVSEAHPDLVIAVDALAARSLDRLLGSVQIADTGIHPGSGVGNKRQGLSHESVGVPVTAIGVCTVVQAMSIAQEALRLLVQQLADDAKFYKILEEMGEPNQNALIEEVLGERLGGLMVTPKEIDLLINDMADVLAESLNRALQPQLDRSEWA